MEGLRSAHSRMGIAVICVAALVVFLGVSTDAAAQRGRGGPQLSAEKLDAAWALQATCVAKELGLSDEAAGKLTTLYKGARKS